MSADPRRPRRPTTPTALRALLVVARMELVSAFRDRQTTLYAVVVPIVLYPFLFWAMIQGAAVLQGTRERTEVELALLADAHSEVPDALAAALSEDPGRAGVERLDVSPLERLEDVRTARERVRRSGEIDAAKSDAALLVRDAGTADSPGDGVGANLYYDSTAPRSELARTRVERRLPEFAANLREAAAAERHADPADLAPLRFEFAVDVAADRARGAYLLSFLLPLLLVVMTVLGAFYPAVDMTAGERERRTRETTLLLPVPRTAVHQGKILAVCATAVIATTLNLFALGFSASHLVALAELGGEIEIDLPLEAFAAIAPLALLFALFVSAVLTGIAASARTFQEGQALLGPVQLLFILPAMAGVLPGMELTPGLACVPVLNVVFAFRALLQGQVLPSEYAITAVSLVVCAGLAVSIAMRVLSREATARSSWVDRLLGRERVADGGPS